MILNDDCFNILPTIKSKSIDLILVDPPYGISRKSMFTQTNDNTSDEMVMKYGKISIDFGDWDREEIDLERLMSEFYRVLRPGGTLICFFDVWKCGQIKDVAESAGFKQPRICQWQKTNPVPINSKRNYLSNAIEFFFTFVKSKKPTFNSEYDNGIYRHTLCHGKERLNHPTQKPLGLIREIIEKHSNEGDVVLDTFAGTGTTAAACHITSRNYIMVERDQKYYDMMCSRLETIKQNTI